MSNNANIWEVGGGPNATSYMPIAGGTFTGNVNGITAPKGDNSTKLATTAFVYAALVALGMGTLGLQNANAVNITGGNIDNTVIGATTSSDGTFSSLKNNATLPAADNSTNAATTAWTVANFVKPNTAVSFTQIIGTSANGQIFGHVDGTGAHDFGIFGDATNVTFGSSDSSKGLRYSQGTGQVSVLGNGGFVSPGGIDNTPIGQTTPSAGSFTALKASQGLSVTGVPTTVPNGTGVIDFSSNTVRIYGANSSNGAGVNVIANYNGGNFQVGSGADTGDKFQVYGSGYFNAGVTFKGQLNVLTPTYGINITNGVDTNYALNITNAVNTQNTITMYGNGKVTLAGPNNAIDLTGSNPYIRFLANTSYGYLGAAAPLISGASANDLALRADNVLHINVAGNSGTTGAGAHSFDANGLHLNGGTTALKAYEEGTFTPTIYGSTTAGTQTYTQQYGAYTRIGRQVFFNLLVSISATSGMAGYASIGGLPYASNSVSGNCSSLTVSRASGVTLQTNFTQYGADIGAGQQVVELLQLGNGGVVDIPVSQIGQSTTYAISGFYFI